VKNVSFQLTDAQQARADAWFKHHWEVVHKNWRPRDMSGFAVWYHFGPTGTGNNVKVECAWCPVGHQGHEVNLTEDFEEGDLLVQYDADWNEVKK
jgi:hypothetical protein